MLRNVTQLWQTAQGRIEPCLPFLTSALKVAFFGIESLDDLLHELWSMGRQLVHLCCAQGPLQCQNLCVNRSSSSIKNSHTRPGRDKFCCYTVDYWMIGCNRQHMLHGLCIDLRSLEPFMEKQFHLPTEACFHRLKPFAAMLARAPLFIVELGSTAPTRADMRIRIPC